jgi:hypothetical protein
MIYWGTKYDNFFEVFIEYGAVVDIGALKKTKIAHKRKLLTFEFDDDTKYAQHAI